jgi:hypothetical protein
LPTRPFWNNRVKRFYLREWRKFSAAYRQV